MSTSIKNSSVSTNFFSTILFLFFIQQLTYLVESIYMLNLLNTQMDMRALGITFLFLPGLLFVLKHNKATYLVIVVIMLACMFLSPLLTTPWRIISSGIGAGIFLSYLGLQLSDSNFPQVRWGRVAAQASMFLILSHIINSLDFTLTETGRPLSWMLVLIAGGLFYFIDYPVSNGSDIKSVSNDERSTINPWFGVLGLAGAIVFIYFAFSSPGVIARWIEGDYIKVQFVLLVGVMAMTHIDIGYFLRLKRFRLLLITWNLLFIIFFIWNILLHRISFPTLESIAPVVVKGTTVLEDVTSYVMLILAPVVFINISWFTQSIKPARLGGPFLGGTVLLILCIFMLIFTNSWGYVGAVSKIFRNQFHIPFALAGIFMFLPILSFKGICFEADAKFKWRFSFVITLLITLFLYVVGFMRSEQEVVVEKRNFDQLTLMTYNIQQGVDLYGNKNFEGQLAKIREINPDIICLQESDAARISGGNSDVVRYFSQKLGYYSYYGPKTVTGTYGTAILSKLPLENTKTIFTYSSKDEIGTAIAVMNLNGRNIKIINSHPAGNDKAREEHINTVVNESLNSENVIAMGDYNFRQDSPYYKKITDVLYDSWLSLYPEAIGSIDEKLLDLEINNRKTSSGILLGNGKIDMTSRIDHIFLSDSFEVLEAHYLPAPESETDHPLYWAVVRFAD